MRILSALLTGCLIWLAACTPEATDALVGTDTSELLYLRHQGADMPVLIEGNTASKTFVVVVHGGPGGNALIYNHFSTNMSDPLEDRYALVYWDQRGSGNASGSYNTDVLTPAQYVEDLDRLVDLLYSRYGQDIGIFLMGHSWGGTLTAAYLIDTTRQARIRGWIEVDGAHDFLLINRTTPGLLIQYGQQQIAEDNNTTKWEKIVEYCQELPAADQLTFEQVIQVNRYANEVEAYLLSAGVTATPETDLGGTLDFFFGSGHNFVSASFNTLLTAGIMSRDLVFSSYSDSLYRIIIPSLFLWGRHDLVVPVVLGEDAYARVSTPELDKRLVIFEESGHSPMLNQVTPFVAEVIDFVEQHR
ncbi:MAG: hypothetical protein OHK0039_40760 [Bacteroidia bacterium]